MVFSVMFIVVIFILAASNSLVPYHYEGSAIFLVYSFVNMYVYYIQYMFSITQQEALKMEGILSNGDLERDHDSLTIGSIDIVDVDLSYHEKSNTHEHYGHSIAEHSCNNFQEDS